MADKPNEFGGGTGLKELTERRGKLAEQIKELGQDPDGWTDEQRTQWDELNQEYDQVDGEFQQAQQKRQVMERMASLDGKGRHPFKPAGSVETNAPGYDPEGGTTLVDAKTGRVIPLYTRDKPVQLTDEERSLHLGRVILSQLVGKDILTDYERRALDTSAPGMNQGLSRQWLDALRARMVLIDAGAGLMPMDAVNTQTVVRVDADPTAEWLAELASSTPSDATLSPVVIDPERLQTTQIISGEAFFDSINANDIMVTTAAAAHAHAVDAAGISGTGTNQPTGILNEANVQEHAITTALTWDIVSEAIEKLEQANVNTPISQLALIVNPRESHGLRIEKASTSGVWLGGEGWTSQVRVFPTTAMPTGNAIVGDFRNLVIANRLQSTTWHESGTVGATDLVLQYARSLRTITRADCKVLKPAAFCKVTGIIAP